MIDKKKLFNSRLDTDKMPYDELYGLSSIRYREQYTRNGLHREVIREADMPNNLRLDYV